MSGSQIVTIGKTDLLKHFQQNLKDRHVLLTDDLHEVLKFGLLATHVLSILMQELDEWQWPFCTSWIWTCKATLEPNLLTQTQMVPLGWPILWAKLVVQRTEQQRQQQQQQQQWQSHQKWQQQTLSAHSFKHTVWSCQSTIFQMHVFDQAQLVRMLRFTHKLLRASDDPSGSQKGTKETEFITSIELIYCKELGFCDCAVLQCLWSPRSVSQTKTVHADLQWPADQNTECKTACIQPEPDACSATLSTLVMALDSWYFQQNRLLLPV